MKWSWSEPTRQDKLSVHWMTFLERWATQNLWSIEDNESQDLELQHLDLHCWSLVLLLPKFFLCPGTSPLSKDVCDLFSILWEPTVGRLWTFKRQQSFKSMIFFNSGTSKLFYYISLYFILLYQHKFVETQERKG